MVSVVCYQQASWGGTNFTDSVTIYYLTSADRTVFIIRGVSLVMMRYINRHYVDIVKRRGCRVNECIVCKIHGSFCLQLQYVKCSLFLSFLHLNVVCAHTHIRQSGCFKIMPLAIKSYLQKRWKFMVGGNG